MGIEEYIVIRHAESIANAEGIYQGWTYNTSLTEFGVKQAELTAMALKKIEGITAIYVSPLLRTYETAEIINQELKIPLVVDRRLSEINHGSWEGKRVDQFTPTEQEVLERWQNQPQTAQMPGGECLQDVVNRVESFLADLKEVNGKTLMVTHDTLKRTILCHWQGWDYDQIWSFELDNCGVTTLGLEPKEIIGLNKTMHLNGFKSGLNRQAL